MVAGYIVLVCGVRLSPCPYSAGLDGNTGGYTLRSNTVNNNHMITREMFTEYAIDCLGYSYDDALEIWHEENGVVENMLTVEEIKACLQYNDIECPHEYIIRPDSRAKKCKKCGVIKIEN